VRILRDVGDKVLGTEDVRERWLRASVINPRIVEFLAAHAEDGDECAMYHMYMFYVHAGFVPDRYSVPLGAALALRN
jgi:hypothetical protein